MIFDIINQVICNDTFDGMLFEPPPEPCLRFPWLFCVFGEVAVLPLELAALKVVSFSLSLYVHFLYKVIWLLLLLIKYPYVVQVIK